jgi:hypothetical protein
LAQFDAANRTDQLSMKMCDIILLRAILTQEIGSHRQRCLVVLDQCYVPMNMSTQNNGRT